ncbi:MAG: hypothetical protein ABSH20_29200 [Tepidisphaeraceae bacterium]|jgi:hypothetical protein
MGMEIDVGLNDEVFFAGVVVAGQVKVAPTPAGLAQQLDMLVTERASQDYPPPPVKEAIRQMLRRGGFRPAGRNKPGSVYLAQAAGEGRFRGIRWRMRRRSAKHRLSDRECFFGIHFVNGFPYALWSKGHGEVFHPPHPARLNYQQSSCIKPGHKGLLPKPVATDSTLRWAWIMHRAWPFVQP